VLIAAGVVLARTAWQDCECGTGQLADTLDMLKGLCAAAIMVIAGGGLIYYQLI
jgi:hypothetical protein